VVRRLLSGGSREIGLTKGIAREFAEKGICAVAIAPGFHETQGHVELGIMDTAQKQAMFSRVPMNIPGDPADLAEIMTFIATSPHTKYLTGAVIAVDGGLTTH
jgi:3-oxoacyl-[acyl-carrier protein] reductase